MENNVVTLDTAKKLKAAGYRHETALAWHVPNIYKDGVATLMLASQLPAMDIPMEQLYAPTAQEIADQLPQNGWPYRNIRIEFHARRDELPWSASFGSETTAYADTITEAAAALWLKLEATK
jgi:hypothetical protein